MLAILRKHVLVVSSIASFSFALSWLSPFRNQIKARVSRRIVTVCTL